MDFRLIRRDPEEIKEKVLNDFRAQIFAALMFGITPQELRDVLETTCSEIKVIPETGPGEEVR